MDRFHIAEALAADLAGARVDPNEAQKALAYLRGKRDPKRFFDYLQAVVNNGQVVIRSRQTLDYYRALQQICQRHLRGMAYQEMAETLGWAIRLLRYYRVVPEAVQRQERSAPQPSPRREEAPHTPPVGSEAREERSAPQPTPAPAQPQDPATPQPPPIPLKHLDVGVELTGNRKGELRVPSLGRGVRVELNLKGYALPKGKTVVGFLSREDAGGSMSGGFRGTLAAIEIDGATLYLIVKPLKKA